jgi:plastocyanin
MTRGAVIRGRQVSSVLLVVCLTVALSLAMAGVGLAARVRVRASGSDRWRPAHLFITEGDTVVWTNPDSRRHRVVAYGGGWRFSRTLDPGDTARRVFGEVRSGGEPYAFRCTFHSSIVGDRCEGMCGLVHVFSS